MTLPEDDPRYARQVRFAPFGREGQARLGRSHVLLVGVGALGTHTASHLVRAGLGRLTLVDRDVVERSNLQRQVLFDEADAAAGRPKATAAAAHLLAARGDAQLTPIVAEFDAATFAGIAPRPDLIVDGTDNFATRYLINDLAIAEGIPWIYGGAVGATGSAAVIVPGRTPCLRCLLPEAPPTGEVGTCETIGVLAPAVAQVAAFQVAEALKLLAGADAARTRGLLSLDVWRGRYGVLLRDAAADPLCRSCGTRELPALRAEPPDLATLCGRDAVQIRPPAGARVDLERLAALLRGVAEDVELQPQMLRFRAEGCGFTVFRGGRALVFGTDEPTRARVLYDRWIGAGA
jgi:adenylyltransferase/sulfurtransferase